MSRFSFCIFRLSNHWVGWESVRALARYQPRFFTVKWQWHYSSLLPLHAEKNMGIARSDTTGTSITGDVRSAIHRWTCSWFIHIDSSDQGCFLDYKCQHDESLASSCWIFMTGFTVHKTLSFVQRWASSNIYRACLGSLLSIYYRNIFHHSEDKTWVLTPVNTVTWVRSLLMFTLELRKAADYSPFLLISLVENIYWDHVCLHACSCALLSSPSPPLQHVQILFPFPYPQYTIQPQPTPFSLVYGLQGPQPRQATAA